MNFLKAKSCLIFLFSCLSYIKKIIEILYNMNDKGLMATYFKDTG